MTASNDDPRPSPNARDKGNATDETQVKPEGFSLDFRDEATQVQSPAAAPRPADIFDASGESAAALSLLRTRLRAVALALSVGFLVFAIWLTIGYLAGLLRQGTTLVWAEYVVTIVLVGTYLWLRGAGEFSPQCARGIEILIFGLPALFFTAELIHSVIASATQFGTISAVSAHGWTILLFAHAIFIPNSWRRAAVVSIVLALLPPCIVTLTCLLESVSRQALVYDPKPLIEMFLGQAVTATLAIIGVRTILHLRSEMQQAKQFGRYHLREKLGAGGMGEVFLAEHQLLRRPCAIKIIRPERASDPYMLARFEREVQATAKLSHWNSIYIYDYGNTADGTLYYVMEYLPGLSLQELVQKSGPLRPERVIYLLRQICSALNEAHGLGLIHRDVKPANVFVSERGGQFDVAKLLDFGLVKPTHDLVEQESELTLAGSFAGSPLYMSPEQALGEVAPDPRSDIYSLGAVAYYMLTGKPPFSGKQAMRLVLQHMNDRPALPSSVLDRSVGWEIPSDLEAIVMRCMEKSQSDRFESACDLEQALAACRDANGWDYRRARQWWHAHCPKLRQAAEKQAECR